MKKSLRLACLLPLLLTGLSCGDIPDVYSISIPNLKIEADSSIVSMDLHINAGTVQAIQNIPIGWNITVDDDASWRCKIKGNSTVGAASLQPDELKRLAFIVRRNESGNFKFDISGTLSTSRSFENAKQIEVKMQDFLLTGVQ
jgi:hypothetical protein